MSAGTDTQGTASTGLRWSQAPGRARWAHARRRAHRQWNIHMPTHRSVQAYKQVTARSSLCRDFSLPRPSLRTLTSSYPQPLQQTRVPGTCWPCPVTPKVRRLKAEPPPDRGRGIPSLPARRATARLRTHPIPALRHLAEGGDPPRLGRANKGLSHQSPERGGNASRRPAAL